MLLWNIYNLSSMTWIEGLISFANHVRGIIKGEVDPKVILDLFPYKSRSNMLNRRS